VKSGVLVLDKPRGPTSHDVVATLRHTLRTKEVGHAGTLDPMATGVLVALVGQATKLSPFVSADDKEYEATIELGTETDTLDADGKPVRRADVPAETRAALRGTREPLHPRLETALAAERARTLQVPPAFSAVHVDGQRAHERARRGEEVVVPPRPAFVISLSVLASGLEPAPWLTVRIAAKKGYFVRSFARDLAEGLGTVGHLTSLRRIRSGAFPVDEAVAVDTPADELYARLLPTAIAAARALPVARLSEVGARDARFGRTVRAEDLDARGEGTSAWMDARGDLVAVGEVRSDGSGRVLRGFGQEED
jgi:tRNA pseudouridine55 synthase